MTSAEVNKKKVSESQEQVPKSEHELCLLSFMEGHIDFPAEVGHLAGSS